MNEIHPSFYQIIRQHRFDSSVSDDQFIASLIIAIKKSTKEIMDCGHGIQNLDSGQCLVCLTIRIESEK